ncbi:glutamate 5-kinase [Azotosporobacter soli]|uniref:glutamate 5-kinase n=1 Tax=Azotosporobacter soli TaxID=3055040 RepID=UPI0031FF130A
MLRREELAQAKRIVVKVGTSTLTHATGKLNVGRVDRLARELTDLVNQGKEIILVTSGAVGVGIDRLGLKERPRTIPEKQAAAAVGQGILMHIYEKMFAEYGQIAAQVLLTREDSVKRSRYANSRNTLLTLIAMGVIPVINENDAVAIEELKIGDNDTLSAMVASIVDADLLIILSDIEGLYTANPQTTPDATLISTVHDVSPEIEALAGGAGSTLGTGGMHTKLQAAKIAVSSGVPMVIATGTRDGVISAIAAGEEIGTLFVSRENRLQIRKRWLAFGARIKGSVTIDSGCERALADGASLLAAGIQTANGSFKAGDTISIMNLTGREMARGIAYYSSEEVARIVGCHTNEIADILGYKSYDEVIHRDNMVILG